MKRTEHTQKWLDALRSGEYEQTMGVLSDGVGYCCIGVAGHVTGLPLTERLASYASIRERLGMRKGDQNKLTRMNDQSKKTFPEIADAIEQMLNVN